MAMMVSYLAIRPGDHSLYSLLATDAYTLRTHTLCVFSKLDFIYSLQHSIISKTCVKGNGIIIALEAFQREAPFLQLDLKLSHCCVQLGHCGH